MKKSRKLLALVLAMMMAFSLMSTASAAYEEGIQPRRPSALRSHCGTMQMVIQESDWTDGYDYTYRMITRTSIGIRSAKSSTLSIADM